MRLWRWLFPPESDRITKLEEQVAIEQSRVRILEEEQSKLMEVIARDRERIRAETRAFLSQHAVDDGN